MNRREFVERRRAIHDWVRHERDRSLRETGQAHRYLTDAEFHVAVDLILRAVQETCEVFATNPALDDAGPQMLEASVRASVRVIILGYQTNADLQRLSQEMVAIPQGTQERQAFLAKLGQLGLGVQHGGPT